MVYEEKKMENRFFLLSINVAGVKNLKKEVRLDFYKKTIDRNFNPDKYRIKAIYGENGAGKSALITAVKIFRDLLVNDNYLNESKTQIFLNEIINKSTRSMQFGCEFLLRTNETIQVYHYVVHIGKGSNGLYEIWYEALKIKNGNYVNNNYKTLFECKNGELKIAECNEKQRELLIKKSMNLLSTHSFIYIVLTNSKGVMKLSLDKFDGLDLVVHILAVSILPLLIKVYLGEEDQHELYFWREQEKKNQLERQALQGKFFPHEEIANQLSSVNEKLVYKKDFEKYKDRIKGLTQFLKIFKPELVTIDIDAKERGDQYECDLNLNYGDYSIDKEFESTGIKKLIRLFDCFTAASSRGIVFIDEMDSNLNDVYLCRLIEYFMYYGKGQLCFTTHNLNPMAVLKENKNSIDFLSSDNHLISWTSRGNASPENYYKNGMIEDLPFNIDAADFVGIFEE